MLEQKARWRFSGDFAEKNTASHMLCSPCPTYNPQWDTGKAAKKKWQSGARCYSCHINSCAWSSVSKGGSGKEGQWARWVIFSRAGLHHRLWAECFSSWNAGLISPQATEGWISFSLKERGQNGYLWRRKHWCSCMRHLLGEDGKGEVILVLPH